MALSAFIDPRRRKKENTGFIYLILFYPKCEVATPSFTIPKDFC